MDQQGARISDTGSGDVELAGEKIGATVFGRALWALCYLPWLIVGQVVAPEMSFLFPRW